MPICHQKKFIFLHIPRCAGTSVESFFGLVQSKHLHGVIRADDHTVTLQHLTLTDLLNAGLVKPEFAEQYFKFTIIRDPFDRMASDYLWQQRHDPKKVFRSMNFTDYLRHAEAVCKQGRYFEEIHWDHFRPMTHYCLDGDDFVLDDILLLEHLDRELALLEPILGRVDLPVMNASSKSHETLRSEKNEKMVYKLYAADKELFDAVMKNADKMINA